MSLMQTLVSTVWLVPLYPLAAFLLTVLGRALPTNAPYVIAGHDDAHAEPPKGGSVPAQLAMGLTIAATAAGLLHSVAALGWLLSNPQGTTLLREWSWIQLGSLHLTLGTLLDAPAVMMLVVVTFISLLIQIYTHGYMRHDGGYAKFFGFLALFNFSMLGLVLAPNLVQMYVFWELVGLSSYLLIGFWFHKPAAAAASLKAFLVNRIGDFGFLAGIVLLLWQSMPWWAAQDGTLTSQGALSFTALAPLADAMAAAPATSGWLLPIGLLLLMGPMAKSAQVPLHTWLPDAMEGPTPISALIHAATMVAAGVFLVARLFPLLAADTFVLPYLMLIGTITAVVGASIALVQTDIKKALAYSTMSQLGFMMASMGLGAYTAALFHLFTHAFFKAMLFLGSGSVIHACDGEQDMRKMGGLLKKLPLTGWTYLIGTIAISGLFWTSGYWSKDEILLAAQQSPFPWVYGVLAATAGVTAFYMFRTFFMTFTGEYRGEAHVHAEDKVMAWPLVVLAVPSAFAGLYLSGALGNSVTFAHWLPTPHTVSSTLHHTAHHLPHGLAAFFTPVGITAQLIGLIGLGLAFIIYKAKLVKTDGIKSTFKGFYALLTNKWYADDINQGLAEGGFLTLCNLNAAKDKYIIDGFVNATASVAQSGGALLARLQSGRVQTYVLTMLLSAMALLAVLQRWGG
jgi:proton-translocating NADH-quinone oxidoreductase chain L